MNTEKLKQKLEEEKALLEKELQSVGRQNPVNRADWEATEEHNIETADLNVKADVEEDIEERHALTDTLEARLQNVALALQKIEEGKYGMCEICGEEIEIDRLEANPAAQTCKKHINVGN